SKLRVFLSGILMFTAPVISFGCVLPLVMEPPGKFRCVARPHTLLLRGLECRSLRIATNFQRLLKGTRPQELRGKAFGPRGKKLRGGGASALRGMISALRNLLVTCGYLVLYFV